MKIFVPHPHIKAHHVKHAAAGLTISGTGIELFNIVPHMGTLMLCIGAVLAIYEPRLVHEIAIEIEGDDNV